MALKELARRCNFGAFLEEALRDRLVCGLKNEATQRRLLSEKDLTYQKACDTAQAMDLAAKDTAEFMGKTPSLKPAINRVATPDRGGCRTRNTSQTGSSGKHCYRCGGKHDAHSCWHKKTKCHGCLKVEHLKHMCKSKQVLETKYVASDETQEGGESSDELGMHYIENSKLSLYKHKREQPSTETGREGNISQISVNIPKHSGSNHRGTTHQDGSGHRGCSVCGIRTSVQARATKVSPEGNRYVTSRLPWSSAEIERRNPSPRQV